MQRSAIEWTEATWNPVTGCTQISPGCAHCYALTFAERFRGVPVTPTRTDSISSFGPSVWNSRFAGRNHGRFSSTQ